MTLKISHFTPIFLGFSIFGSQCGMGSDYQGPDPTPPETMTTWQNKKPIIYQVGPLRLSVGNEMTISGSDFVDRSHGKISIKFKGIYTDSDGVRTPLDKSFIGYASTPNQIKWKMLPDIVFDRTGN